MQPGVSRTESLLLLSIMQSAGCERKHAKYLNQYKAADEQSKDIAKQLIDLEHQLTLDLRRFL